MKNSKYYLSISNYLSSFSDRMGSRDGRGGEAMERKLRKKRAKMCCIHVLSPPKVCEMCCKHVLMKKPVNA